MRYVLALLLASIVSISLFQMMYWLINDEQTYIAPETFAQVDISRVKAPEKNPRQAQDEQKTEPQMQAFALAEQLNVSDASVEVDIPFSDVAWEHNDLNIEQKYWTQPVIAGGGGDDAYVGERNEGKKTLRPESSRMPNIPKVAYENKVNGWVLLAFAITPGGNVKNIRVMDAQPRGIFEANAIAAVRGWKYPVFTGSDKYISQRIDFDWTYYQYNLKYD